MKIEKWIERVSAVLTLGLLALIAYEQSATVARLTAIVRPVSPAKHFARTLVSSRIPAASRQPRRPAAPTWLRSDANANAPHSSTHAPELRLARADDTPSPLVTRLLVVPDRAAGKPGGVRLFGIHPGTLLALLGLENGDRLESINGLPVTTPEQALAAYAQLRGSSRLSVAIQRRDKPLLIHYELI